MSEIVVMSDPRVTEIPLRECGEPMVDLRTTGLRLDDRLADSAGAYALLRQGVADRVLTAQQALPEGLRFLVIEGFRPLELQRRYFAQYSDELRRDNPSWSEEFLRTQTSRSLSPPEIGPHVAGAAIDLTMCTLDGAELDMGTAVNASPEESDLACYTAAVAISAVARRNRRVLSDALTGAGLVNYPTEWWHWSYGDRYWALTTGADRAIYGPQSPRL